MDTKATIINKLNSTTSNVAMNKQIVELNTNGKPTLKIKFHDYDSSHIDTIFDSYEENLLKNFSRYNGRLIESSAVFYNKQADVDSIVTCYPKYNGNQAYFDPESKERNVRRFKNYDQTPHSFRSLAIFEETFHRSLLAHNYSKWEETIYDYNGHVIVNRCEEWTFIRENGIINFGL